MKNIFKPFFSNSSHAKAHAPSRRFISFTSTVRTVCSALLLAAATFVGAGQAWAQTYTASSGNAGAGADGRTDTRWESTHGSDDQWWMADYGTSQTFTSIEIVWEGAYANDFNLLASDDGETWTTLKEVRNQKLSGFPNTQKYIFNDEMTFRYVKFQGIKRETQYGYSFYEFRLIYEPHTYSASSQNENIAANGADGDNDTRWESEHGDASQWWQVDYQNPRTFDQINILWNECYARDLQILATNDPDVAAQNPTGTGWTTLATFNDLDLPKDGVRATQQINLEESVSYRYVRVLGTERAPAGDTNYYGYSFYEFKAQPTAPRVAKMTVNGTNELYASQKTTFNTTAVDQFGNAITPNVTYTVSPAEAGTFNGNEFTALLEVDAVITATDATGVVAKLSVSIVGYNPQIRYLTLTSDKYSVAEGEDFVLSLKGVDQYGDEYEITEADHDISFAIKPQGYVEHVSGFNFRATDSGKAKITVTASPKAAPSAHRAPGFVDATLSDDVTITVTSTTPHILKDYKSFQFVHTQGAKYWLDGYGNFDGTYYYSPTKETRHYIDSEYLRYGIPDMTTQKEALLDPRILPYAAGNGNYYIENGSTIQAGNVRQRTHWMEHTVWAKPGEEVYLYPFSDFATQNAYLEQYMRWYDYATDKAAEGLSFDKRHYYSPDFGVISGRGWLGNNRNDYATVAHYTAPASFNTTADQHIYIACDLSQTGVKDQVLNTVYNVVGTDIWNDSQTTNTDAGRIYFAPNWNPNANYEVSHEDDWYKFVLHDATNARWQAQFYLLNHLQLEAGKKYVMSGKLQSSSSFTSEVKVQGDNNNSAPATTSFDGNFAIKQGENAFNFVLAPTVTRGYEFLFDFGGNPAETTIIISDVHICELDAEDPVTYEPVIYEPIIHGRQLFNIRPAGYIADQLSNHNADYISSVRRKIAARAGARFNVRLDYEMPVEMDTKSPLYYMNGGNVEHIYGYKIHTYKNGAEVTNIFVGDEDRFAADARKYSAIMTGLDGKKYYRGIKCEAENAAVGVYVVKIIGCDASGNELTTSGGAPLEIMEYEVTFLDAKEASFLTEAEEATLAKDEPETYGNHTESYLRKRAEEDYSEAATVTFDTYDDTQFRPHMFPGEYAGEYYKWPVVWRGCTYMYGYNIQRRDAGGGYDGNDFNMYMLTKHSATFACKSAANAYDDHLYAEATGLPARQNESSPMGKYGLYDRTFYSTGGATMGNFFAVNASSDPGRMVDAQIDELCLGSTLYVSAWVAELSNKNSWGDGGGDFEYCNETANLIFNFNAVTKTGTKIPLHSFTTGYVDRGNGYSEYMNKPYWDGGSIKRSDWEASIQQGTGQQGQWMHVYYTFVPDASSLTQAQIESIAYYELSLENNCVSSDGADYAIDDVRVFISRPLVMAEQLKPVCSGEKETDVKVSASFESLLSSLGKTEAVAPAEGEWVYFYYTFLDYDKYYGEGHPTHPKDRFDQAVLDYKYLTTVSDGNITVDTNNDQRFGIAKFNTRFDQNISYTAHPESGSEVTWGDLDKYDNRYIVFNTHPTDGKLYPGKEYIISLYAPANGVMHHTDSDWDENMYVYFPVDDKCAKRCIFRVHSSGMVKINGKIITDEDEILVCDNQYPIVQIDAFGFDSTNKEVLPNAIELQAPFDWYGGSMKEYMAEKRTIDGVEMGLDEVLSAYRTEYPVVNFTQDLAIYSDATRPAKGTYTEGMRQYLIDMTTPADGKAAKLALYQRSFTMTPGALTDASGRQACYLVAIPVEPSHYIINGEERDDILICTDPSEIRVYIDAHSPHIVHGFAHDEHYPAYIDDVPLRIGLDQLATVTRVHSALAGYLPGDANEADLLAGPVLSIPLRQVNSSVGGDAIKQLVRTNDAVVYLAETNDPEYSRLPISTSTIHAYPAADADDAILLPQVGVILEVNASTKQADIEADHDYFRMAFCEHFHFKEGYYYRFLFNYTEEYPDDYNGERTTCDGQRIITFKVVPKYQMWTGAAGNTDWNNDRNWRRITSDELLHDFSDPSASEEDPMRHKLADGHDGHDGHDAKAGYDNRMSYVPMDFTDVIIPKAVTTAGVNYPSLYERPDDIKDVTIEEDGHFYTWPWPRGGNEGTGVEEALKPTATKDIEYDMEAWFSPRGVNCRPWYANTCEHITFLDGAAMHNQQFLNYQRAWVELEIAKDRWYTLTSPLLTTVSGDMYLPTTGKSPARQMTEHFQPITYSAALNDRFRPAVYQRSWDHSDERALIFRMDNDGMYGGANSRQDNAYVASTWSHVFNDVREVYSEGRGFSVLTDVSRLATASSIDKVLFRLPKDDQSYYYHNSQLPGTNGDKDPAGYVPPTDVDGNPITGNDPVNDNGQFSGTYKGDNTPIDRSVTIGGQQVTTYSAPLYKDDGVQVYSPEAPYAARLNPTNGSISVKNAKAGKYFLVGNPLMTYLDMKAFFDANTQLERKFWIVTEGHQEVAIMTDAEEVGTAPGTVSVVAPMQAFFVEATAATDNITLAYDETMMKEYPMTNVVIRVDGNQPDVPTNGPIVNPNGQDTPPVLRAPATRSGAALDGQLRILLTDPAEQESATDHSPRLVSTAVVALKPMASADYNAKEDAILLLDSNLDAQSALYTVAGETAVSINRLERVDIVPLGIVCNDDEAAKKMLTLSFDGADAFPQPLYLYDAQSGETTALTDDLSLNVPANTAGQYFITTGLDQIDDETAPAGPMYNLKGIRVANTRNERVIIQGSRKSVVK